MKKISIYVLGMLTLLLVGWKTTDNLIRLGDGAATNKTIEANIGSGATNPKMLFNATTNKWQFTNDGVNVVDFGSGSGAGSGINLLDNPGCEFGSSTPDDWTASGGSLTRTTTAANVGFGEAACSFDASSSGQSIRPSDVLVPELLEGNACVAEIYYKADTITNGDYIFYVELDDGTDLTSSVSLNATNGSWVRSFVAFTCPTGDSIRFKIESAVANPGAILVDQAHLGSNKNDLLAQNPVEVVTKAKVVAANNCSWENPDSTALAAFASDTDCTGIVVDSSSPIVSINTADSNLPDLVYTSLPSGNYRVEVNFTSRINNNSCQYALYDGTSYSGRANTKTATSGTGMPSTIVGYFSHSGGAKTFSIHGAETGDNCFLEVSDNFGTTGADQLTWTVTRYPSTSTSSVTLETQGAVLRAYHENNCDWTNTTSTSYADGTADASCTFTVLQNSGFTGVISEHNGTPGTNFSGIRFVAPYNGNFWVCAQSALLGQTSGEYYSLRLYDQLNGTSLNETVWRPSGSSGTSNLTSCGVLTVTSPSATQILRLQGRGTAGFFNIGQNNTTNSSRANIEWTVVPLSQNFPQAVALTDVSISELSDEVYDISQTVTVVATGESAGEDMTARLTKVGRYVNAVFSNDSNITLAGTTLAFPLLIPANYRPTQKNVSCITQYYDGSVYAAINANIQTNGAVEFFKTTANGAWTATNVFNATGPEMICSWIVQ